MGHKTLGFSLLSFAINLANGSIMSPGDPSSFSRPDLVAVKHMDIFLEADFQEEIFSGHVILHLEKRSHVNELILDTESLHVFSVTETKRNRALQHKFLNDKSHEKYGTKMVIKLPSGNRFVIKVCYKTNPSASGLLWAKAEQTVGKLQPYLLSNFEYIGARGFVPCQDTPSSKITYTAEIRCPKDLQVLMPGTKLREPLVRDTSTTYFYKQDIPVPTYLIAIAIGLLDHRNISLKTAIYSEKEVVDAAAYEFANVPKQLQAAESICGPYIWGRYDVIVLPPIFPYGGMKNPSVTFATPTLLAGDRSLVDVVAHEIGHSWSGNLVTNANFEHVWLNEGLATFLERRIIGKTKGKRLEDLLAYIGLSALEQDIQRLGEENPMTRLVLNLTNVHPDEIYSKVPYEKGYLFLRYLEEVVGGPSRFEKFLKSYFQAFKFQSITTQDFKSYFLKYFEGPRTKTIHWDSWLHGLGMPPDLPVYDNTYRDQVMEKKHVYLNWELEQTRTFPIDPEELNPSQKILLLEEVLEDGAQPVRKLETWDAAWNMSSEQNAEIKYRWLRIGVISRWRHVLRPALDFVTEIGRMQYIRPIYRDLYAWEEVRSKVIETFKRNEESMMNIAVHTVRTDLHL